MTAVAEGLVCGLPASAKIVGFSFFEFYGGGSVVSYDRFAHGAGWLD